MIRIPTLPTLSTAILALLATSSAFATNTVYLEAGNVYGSNPYGDSDGGEFTALTNTAIPSGYVAATKFTYGSLSGNSTGATTGFETFCVEDETYFWVDTTYDYTVSNYIDVPAGGPLTNGPGYTTAGLDVGIAYLYAQFATGTLANYDYNLANDPTDSADRNADAGVLQQAIWDLQGPSADPDVQSPMTVAEIDSNTYLLAAYNEFGDSLTTLEKSTVAYGNDFGVQVMNLADSGAGVYQNQLILDGVSVPRVPDGGSAVLLLGVGFLALFGFRFRSKQSV